MIRVILKDERVLQYNDPDNISKYESGFIALTGKKGWFVQINPELIERIEFEKNKPCRIMKDKRNKKKMETY